MTHSDCTRCTCCGACACTYGDFCQDCDFYLHAQTVARVFLDETLPAALRAPGEWFIQNPTSRLVHRVDCPSYQRAYTELDQALHVPCHSTDGEPSMIPIPQPPKLLRADQLRRGRRCKMCAPDVTPEPPRKRRQWHDGIPRRQVAATAWTATPAGVMTRVTDPGEYRLEVEFDVTGRPRAVLFRVTTGEDTTDA